MQLSSIVNHYFTQSEIYNKSDKAIKSRVAKLTKAAFDQLSDELPILGNTFTIDGQKYFVEATSRELVNSTTGEVFTRFSLWYNAATKVDTPQSVVSQDEANVA